MGLLIITTATSFNTVPAQEDNKTILNNTTLSGNMLNLSATNSTVLNATNTVKVNPANNNSTFIISSDMKVKLMNGIKINASANDSGTQSPRKAIFVIDSFSVPIGERANESQSLINADYLSRKVAETPHGYVTYHN